MSKPKNAPVVAKTAPKKRGRPVGSKNKPVFDGQARIKAAKAMLSSEGWVPPPTDWEKLAKRLQEALAAEMKENEALKAIVADIKNVVRTDSSFTFWDRLVFLFSGKL